MNREEERYRKVVELMRSSKPQPESTDEIAREVIRRIEKRSRMSEIQNMMDFLFGWTYIGWVRRSLMTAAMIMVGFFIYQQGMIIRKIDFLNRQVTVSNSQHSYVTPADIEKFLTLYRSEGKMIFPAKKPEITEKQADEIFRSLNDLRLRYRELENLIESDSGLRKMIEQKLAKDSITKTNL